MIVKYRLLENDLLQYHLFKASKSVVIKKQRKKNWLRVTLSLFALGIIFYWDDRSVGSYSSFLLGFLSLFYYPIFQRNRYKQNYQKLIRESYSKVIGETATFIFSEKDFLTADPTGEVKINQSDVEALTETGEYFFLSLRSGAILFIPKLQVGNVDELREALVEMAAQINVKLVSDPNWKWK